MGAKLHFSKMHGLGNDFMVIDAIAQDVSLSAEQIQGWADRHFGVGFDQLLLVEATRYRRGGFSLSHFQCGWFPRCSNAVTVHVVLRNLCMTKA